MRSVIDAHWQPYLEKMKEVERAVKLTAWWTREVGEHCNAIADNIEEYINKPKVEAGNYE